jgi:hypothetical protein
LRGTSKKSSPIIQLISTTAARSEEFPIPRDSVVMPSSD